LIIFCPLLPFRYFVSKGEVVFMWYVVLWIMISILALVIGIVFEISNNVFIAMIMVPFVIIFLVRHYLEVTRKPLISTKVKINKIWGGRGCNFIKCLLPDKSTVVLEVTIKQSRDLKKNSVVDLVYQGLLARSIKKHPNGVVIYRDGPSQRIIEKRANQILTYEQATKRK